MSEQQASAFEQLLKVYQITDERLEQMIVERHYWLVPNTFVTICALVLDNGFTVTGMSACATAAEFNEELGRNVAYEKAKTKL